MKRIKYLILVCLVISSGIASAETLTINPTDVWRYAAYNTDIGVQASDYINGQGWCAWSQIGATACDFRNVINYDVQPSVLGITSAQVVSATLDFTTTAWQAGREAVTVDQIYSWFGFGPNWIDMYSSPAWDVAVGIVTNGSTNGGIFSVDITAALKAAIDSAYAHHGIAFRFYNDNDADPTAPFDGTSVVLETGFNMIVLPTIVVQVRALPSTCGDDGTIYLTSDVNHDCKVDFADFADMAAGWMGCTTPEDENCSGWYN